MIYPILGASIIGAMAGASLFDWYGAVLGVIVVALYVLRVRPTT